MAGLIEDYALIGDMQTAALVGLNGCVEWLCLPRFDSPACFAALLGDEHNGHWLIAPVASQVPAARGNAVSRRYQGDTLILETEWTTASGVVRVIDFMPPRGGEQPVLIRIVRGVRGTVEMETVLRLRFGYGQDHSLGAQGQGHRGGDRGGRAGLGVAAQPGPADREGHGPRGDVRGVSR